MSEYTIESTKFVSIAGADRPRLAQGIIDGTETMPPKFVLMLDKTRHKVISLIILPGLGIEHFKIAKTLERAGLGVFFGAGKIKNIGQDSSTAMWGSYTCSKVYGRDTPDGLEERESVSILELVKVEALKCLESVARGEEPS